MKKNKNIIILTSILVILILIIILLIFNIKNKSTFVKPKFESNVSTTIPENIDYSSQTIDISNGYSIYIDGIPSIKEDKLVVNFISMKDNNVWIKIRILNEDEKNIAESGLVKPGEYLESIQIDKKLSKNDNITYEIIGYEIESYLSAGTVKLNTKVGD